MDYVLDVILLSHNRIDLTAEAVNALYNNTHNPFHLIVMDDSKDLTPLFLGELVKQKDNVTLNYNPDGYIEGNQMFNIGFSKCKTPFVATIMNSCAVQPDWDIHALNLMEWVPECGTVGMKSVYWDGRIESAGCLMMDSALVDEGKYADICAQMVADIGRDAPGFWFGHNFEVDACQWAGALHRLKAVNPLPEGIYYGFVGMDDLDNCFVVRQRGWNIYTCGASTYIHKPRSTRGDNSELAARKNRFNQLTFFERWGYGKGIIPVPVKDESPSNSTDT